MNKKELSADKYYQFRKIIQEATREELSSLQLMLENEIRLSEIAIKEGMEDRK